MKLLVALPILLASAAHGPRPPQYVQLRHTCDAAAASITKLVQHAGTAQPGVITAQLRVLTPGTLTGQITFNPSGSTIQVAGGPASGGYVCATGAIAPGTPQGPGHSQIVSTLRRTFTAAGRYTLTFALNRTGQRILARLGARDRAYRRRHPRGRRPPSIAFGVGLGYTPTG